MKSASACLKLFGHRQHQAAPLNLQYGRVQNLLSASGPTRGILYQWYSTQREVLEIPQNNKHQSIQVLYVLCTAVAQQKIPRSSLMVILISLAMLHGVKRNNMLSKTLQKNLFAHIQSVTALGTQSRASLANLGSGESDKTRNQQHPDDASALKEFGIQQLRLLLGHSVQSIYCITLYILNILVSMSKCQFLTLEGLSRVRQVLQLNVPKSQHNEVCKEPPPF